MKEEPKITGPIAVATALDVMKERDEVYGFTLTPLTKEQIKAAMQDPSKCAKGTDDKLLEKDAGGGFCLECEQTTRFFNGVDFHCPHADVLMHGSKKVK